MLSVRIENRRAIGMLNNIHDTLTQEGANRLGWSAAAVVYSQHISRTFREEGDPKWAPLRPATIRRRRKGKRKGGSPKILQDTADLKNSVTTPNHPKNYLRIHGSRMEYGTKIPYGIHHQEGAPNVGASGGMPARKFLTINQTTLAKMAAARFRTITRLAAAKPR